MKDLLLNIQQPCLFMAIALVFLSCIQNKEANKFIDAENEANSSDYRKTKLPRASSASMIVTLVLLCIAFAGTYLRG